MTRFVPAAAPVSHGNCCDGIPPIDPRSRMVAANSDSSCSSEPAPTTLPAGGFTFVEDSTLPANRATIIWSADFDPNVLPIVAEPAKRGAGFDLSKFGSRAAVVASEGREHVAIRGDEGFLRLDVMSGSLRTGPALLSHRISRTADLDAHMPTLHQLAAYCEWGASAPWILPADPRLERLILALRVLDARQEGTSLRDVATGLQGAGEARTDWPGENDSTKSWIRRLVAVADALWRLGPRGILAGKI